jgi:hypothetical protein
MLTQGQPLRLIPVEEKENVQSSEDGKREQVIERIALLFRNKPDRKLDPVKGAYTALALFLPLIVLAKLGYSEFGVLVLLGALLTSFGDIATSYRLQMLALGITAAGGAIMTALGRVVGEPWWLAQLALFLVVFISGLFSVYGNIVAAVGLLLTVPFVISLSASSKNPATALLAAEGYLLGGAILLLFALVAGLLKPNHNRAESIALPVRRSRPTLSMLTSQFIPPSPLFRYALLRAIGTVSAVVIGWELGGAYPYWAALTVLICAKQDEQMSLTTALQYGVASLLGALLAEGLIVGVPLVVGVPRLVLVGLIVVAITFIAFTVKARNYTLYIFFFTTLILLLLSIGTAGYSYAVWRIAATQIGIAIVLEIIWLNRTIMLVLEKRKLHTFSEE